MMMGRRSGDTSVIRMSGASGAGTGSTMCACGSQSKGSRGCHATLLKARYMAVESHLLWSARRHKNHAAAGIARRPLSHACQLPTGTLASLAARACVNFRASRSSLISSGVGGAIGSCAPASTRSVQALHIVTGMPVSPASHRCQVRYETPAKYAAVSCDRPAKCRADFISLAAG